MKMREDADVLPGRRKFVVTRKRNKNFIADPVDIDNRLGGQRVDKFAAEKCNHEDRR